MKGNSGATPNNDLIKVYCVMDLAIKDFKMVSRQALKVKLMLSSLFNGIT